MTHDSPARLLVRAALLALLGGVGCRAAADMPPLTVALRARAVAPGEPVRIEAVSSEPLGSLVATFDERPVFMARSAADAGTERWSGWSLVPLDGRAGPTRVALSGRTLGGAAVGATLDVEIEPRTFPEERLRVASRYVKPPEEIGERIERERRRLAEIYASRTPPPPLERPFVRPVPGEPTSIFGLRRIYNGEPRSPHPGLDLRAATGTPVLAAGPGRVVLAAELYYSGNTVIVDHGGGLFTIYAHLSELLVAEDRPVDAGTRVGLSGATGRVTGPHLHWGAKIGELPFDPQALLDERLF